MLLTAAIPSVVLQILLMTWCKTATVFGDRLLQNIQKTREVLLEAWNQKSTCRNRMRKLSICRQKLITAPRIWDLIERKYVESCPNLIILPLGMIINFSVQIIRLFIFICHLTGIAKALFRLLVSQIYQI